MRWLSTSPTHKKPNVSTATPKGLEKLAAAPVPFAKAAAPLPASVLTFA
jgi:hypothetical protein